MLYIISWVLAAAIGYMVIQNRRDKKEWAEWKAAKKLKREQQHHGKE